MNSEFFLLLGSYVIKAKSPSHPNYLPIAGEEKRWIYDFPKVIRIKWNANNLI